ncbi:Sodium:proton antiporter [Rhodovastum atsumiense]|uniref:Sodium:proton antiporter n=1 Tax=Rhodovastum atsumiense TaxID=504468 RepID=A0A5M6IWL9_9PROT|nr:cation:proton antiporter [Rhodovastum atsumiense]KAA5612692.1 sodium:proton antiporter [Rhodovastum atsumiense]CAH2602759.1 Sodium:proton antiporter [Rhodovastum atsumiense]
MVAQSLYQNIAVLAAFLLAYAFVAGRVERSWLSGPIIFTLAGLALGKDGLGLLQLQLIAEPLRILAELTLAMVLFSDAANADFRVLRANLGIPQRLLLIGLPLTVILGAAAAFWLFPWLDPLEMGLLAAMLAPTDAALGRPVVTNAAVPARIREGLNVESGLNDGICVPLVVILLGLAIGTQIEGGTPAHVVFVVAEEIGIGLAVGLALTAGGMWLLDRAERHGWTSESWRDIPLAALAAACFALAQAIGGSGFIACFTGGLLLSPSPHARKEKLLRGTENTGEALALLTWVLFGAAAIGPLLARVTWPTLAYAALSLTVIRMLPVFLCLIGTGTSLAAKLFIGWFGPRGLASIVFGIIVLDEHLPGNDTLILTVACTVALSVLAHGISANPLVHWLAARLGTGGDAAAATGEA